MRIFDIYIKIFKRNKWLTIFAVLVYLIFIVIYTTELKDKIGISNTQISEVDKYKTEYFKLTNDLLNQKDSTQISIETLKFGFNSVNRKSQGKLFEYGFVNVLEDYLVHIVSNEKSFPKDKYNYLTNIIQEELKQEPFSQLQSDQRRVLKNL